MKILTGNNIKKADEATIVNEPVSSLDLMERASHAIAEEIIRIAASYCCEGDATDAGPCRILVVAGKGNNGGDGLAVARLLSAVRRRDTTAGMPIPFSENRRVDGVSADFMAVLPGSIPESGRDRMFDCTVFISCGEEEMTPECRANFLRLPKSVKVIGGDTEMLRGYVENTPDAIIIDALLGSGIRGTVRDGHIRSLIDCINSSGRLVVSIDMPSGLPSEFAEHVQEDGIHGDGLVAVRADATISVQFPKLSLLLPDTGEYAGKVIAVPIGLSEEFIERADENFYYADAREVAGLLHGESRTMPFEARSKSSVSGFRGAFQFESGLPSRRLCISCAGDGLRFPGIAGRRPKYSHKGNYGHCFLVCGSEGMMGAAVLSVSAALRSGCGLVTAHVPYSERTAMQVSNPSAMVVFDERGFFSASYPAAALSKYTAICAGPGLGRNPVTAVALAGLLESARELSMPFVLDADALNIIAEDKHMQEMLYHGCVLTPHPGELRRLVGPWTGDEEKISKVSAFSARTGAVVLVKGANTMTCLPDGRIYINSTGNPGMAKGGCGDVLAGLIAGLMAKGLSCGTAAVAGVYFHGLAGDRAAAALGGEPMNSSDLLDFLSV